LQITTDSTFASTPFDENSIFQTSCQMDTLLLNTTYYWHVCGINSSGASGWSVPSHFTTIADRYLPITWSYIAQTGCSATITIPNTLTPLIGDSALKSGDAIGVFYPRGETSVCAGYGVWNEGNTLLITIWGDNPSTTVKDGLSTSDTLLFKIWSAKNQREYHGIVAYQSGNPIFTGGGTYVIHSLSDSTSHSGGGTTRVASTGYPPTFVLRQNYPNPFNPSTTIEYAIPERAGVTLEIFDNLGRKIEILIDKQQDAGRYGVHYDASCLASGVYYYRLTVQPISGNQPAFISKMRMVFMK
jgi:hypothetical protein